MEIQDAHIKKARMVLQPCVEAFEADLSNHKTDLSKLSDGDIIRAHDFIADYERCLTGG